MLQLMAEMMKLPVSLFVSGMEVFVRAMREWQHAADQALDAAVKEVGAGAAGGGGAESGADPPPAPGTGCAAEMSATSAQDSKGKERDAMIDDRALGSDDLKTVRYRIIFTKRNHETTLKEDETTVNYATDPMSLSGRHIADFWASAAVKGEQKALERLYKARYYDVYHTEGNDKGLRIKIDVLKAAVEPKPPAQAVPVGWTIAEEDKKYIAFRADLLDQLPRQKGEYEREKAEELREIKRILDERL
jgi:hypothetical protein